MAEAPQLGPRAAFVQSKSEPRPSHRSVTEWTRQRLYQRLLEGPWVPGDVVHEVQLAEELGVSRSPVRDALAELEREGLLIRAGQGSRRQVAGFDSSDVEELYDLRAAIECLAVRYVAPNISDDALERLDRLLDEMRSVVPGSGGRGRSFAADFEFHQLIVHTAGRVRLHETLRRCWLQTRVMLADLNRRGIYPTAAEMDRVMQEHQRVYDALLRRDSEDAAEALAAHVMGAKDRVLASIAAGRSSYEMG